ncbi:MAG: AbrB/MazE/SpoVT family DNA-binding domain-containing protein [candidate division Zixibacteria bacterium]|nr:AbrB/MazE/SpoVT family DNA-binding domain-containing protein [candidate division Zixibacteria bacterium]
MGEQIKVLQKGKITVPAKVRQKYGISEGDYITLEIVDGKLVLLPPKTVPNPTDLLSGLAEGVQVAEPVKQELRKAAATRMKNKASRTRQ